MCLIVVEQVTITSFRESLLFSTEIAISDKTNQESDLKRLKTLLLLLVSVLTVNCNFNQGKVYPGQDNLNSGVSSDLYLWTQKGSKIKTLEAQTNGIWVVLVETNLSPDPEAPDCENMNGFFLRRNSNENYEARSLLLKGAYISRKEIAVGYSSCDPSGWIELGPVRLD